MKARNHQSFSGALLWPAVLSAMLLAGCMVGPDYVKPDVPVAASWHAPAARDVAAHTVQGGDRTLAAWWTTLGDPELTSLVARALAGSLDVKKARARIREARAQKGVARGDLFPVIDATASAGRNWTSDSGTLGSYGSFYNAGFDASWEVDVFGGLRRSVEAAEGDLQASVEDLRDVLVTLLAEVATDYVNVRTYQARLWVARENLKSQTETYNLTVWQNKAGLSDDLAVEQARYNLESTRSQIPALETQLESNLNQLAVLLGEQPGALHAELESPRPIPVTPLTAVVGVPADMLRRRPDVRRAERQLAAQTARVGVAKAKLYPSFTLSGSIGLEALSLSNFVSSPVTIASAGLNAATPIFHGGSLRQGVEVQSALQELYLIAYESTVLAALKEVEDAIVAYAKEQQRRETLKDGEAAARNAAQLARHKYEAGLVDFTTILETERSLLSFQDQLHQSEGALATDLVKLYKALGGGWESPAPEDSGQPGKGETK